MALVAYDDSSTSELEDEEPPTTTLNNGKNVLPTDKSSSAITGLLASVPGVSRVAPPREEEDEFLRKRARIVTLTPQQFKDVETIRAKPRAAASSKSGLLSLLPQPKHSAPTAASPRASAAGAPLAKRPSAPLLPRVLAAPPVAAPAISASPPASPPHDNDFFSITRPPDRFTPPPSMSPPHVSMSSPPVSVSPPRSAGLINSQELTVESGGGNASNGDVLDEEALVALCGSRVKRRREHAVVIDAAAGLWDPTRAALQDAPAPQPKRGDGPTANQRRKHHITYLAHQAKANEAELQNHWASGRQNKRQASAKYGF